MKEDIISMARRAGAHDNGFEVRFLEPRYLERFADLVRADEREACAKVAENRMLLDASVKENVAHHTACKNIAADIRSRGKA